MKNKMSSEDSKYWKLIAKIPFEIISIITFALLVNVFTSLEWKMSYFLSLFFSFSASILISICILIKNKTEEEINNTLTYEGNSSLKRVLELKQQKYQKVGPKLLVFLGVAIMALVIGAVSLFVGTRQSNNQISEEQELLKKITNNLICLKQEIKSSSESNHLYMTQMHDQLVKNQQNTLASIAKLNYDKDIQALIKKQLELEKRIILLAKRFEKDMSKQSDIHREIKNLINESITHIIETCKKPAKVY